MMRLETELRRQILISLFSCLFTFTDLADDGLAKSRGHIYYNLM